MIPPTASLTPARVRRACLRPLPRATPCEGPLGVTLASPGYESLVEESVRRFRTHTGWTVVVLHVPQEPCYTAKLNLDLLVAPRPIVFFDIDWWLLRPVDLTPLASGDRFCAVNDPGVFHEGTFTQRDTAREGWERESYFNSGFFACDLERPEIRAVFAAARQRLADCHAGRAPRPADHSDQYYLNWAVQQQPGLFRRLPIEYNYYHRCVEWGNHPHPPRAVVGLHAAGYPREDKLRVLREQAGIFGGAVGPLRAEAREHYVRAGWRLELEEPAPWSVQPQHRPPTEPEPIFLPQGVPLSGDTPAAAKA